MIRVTVTGAEQVRARMKQIAAGIDSSLAGTAVWTEDQISAGAGKHAKTGRLERSIFKRRGTGPVWLVGHDLQIANYAQWVVGGSRPHVIVPREKRALRWAVGGRFVFARRVRHPGYRGDDYVKRAADAVPREFERRLAAIIQREG